MFAFFRFFLRSAAPLVILCALLAGVALVVGQGVKTHLLVLVSGLIEDNQIYLYDVEQGSLVPASILPGGYLEVPPILSPDGTRIAYYLVEDSRYSLYIGSLFGKSRQIFSSHQPLTSWYWSPDGRQLALNITEDSRDIYLVDVNTGQFTNVGTPRFNEHTYGWSPDGAQLLLSSDRIGYDELYVMDLNARTLHLVTDFPRYTVYSAEWSPDGTKIVTIFEGDIWVVNPVDGIESALTQDDYGELPAWSPDGTQITFLSYNDNGGKGIFVMNADGSQRRDLVQEVLGTYEYNPVWTLDSTYIAFEAATAGEYDIYIIQPDGSNLRHITPDDPDCQCSPNYYILGWLP